MRRTLSVILFIVLSLLIASSCRAHREVKRDNSLSSTMVSGLESRRVESLWDFLAEKYNIHVEFFPPQYTFPTSETLQEPAPSLAMSADSTHISSPLSGGRSGFGGLGAVKSIDIVTERETNTKSTSETDTTAVVATATSETSHTEKTADLRQDNGTVAIVAAAAALVVAFLAFLIYKYFKR